jgi:CO/xanthine dehydrogenase Mo-binding subunit
MSTQLNVVGKYMGPRLDGAAKIAGQFKFGDDFSLPGQAYMKMLKSPYPHAKITAVDASEALAMKGVLGVITPEDVKDNPYRLAGTTMMILPYDKVRYAGEEVCAVAAEDPHVAEEALSKINVTYDPLPFVLDPEEAMKAGAPEIHTGGNLVRGGPSATFTFGDTAAGMAQADKVIEGRYETVFNQHSNIEPWAGLVNWDTGSGRLDIYTDSQYMHGVRNGTATALGIPISRVAVYNNGGSGGFGDKTGTHRWFILAALLSKKVGRPIKFRLTKEENLLQGIHRYKVIYYIKTGVKNDGTVTAMEETVISDAAAYYYTGGSGAALETYAIYKFPNFKITVYDVYTNKGRSGPRRCVGDPQGCFAIETHMDKVATTLGMNPMDFRKKNNMYVKGDKDQLTGNRIPMIEQPACIDKARQISGWDTKWKPFDKSKPLKGVVHGIGMANHCCAHGAGSLPNAAVVVMNPDGSATVHVGASSIGNGRRTQLAIIAAEHLGLPVEKVNISNYSTIESPDSGGTYGSRQTKSAGNAVGLAALDARDQLLDRAAAKLGVPKDQLSVGVEKIYVTADPTKFVNHVGLVSSPPWIIGRGQWVPPTKTTQRTYATHVCEVDVDTDTGLVKVTNYYAVHGVGRRIFVPGIEGQCHGGIIQGIGEVLQEELLVDQPTGKFLNTSMLDHKMPAFTQVPTSIVTDWVEDPESPPDSYNFGAKGFAEPPNAATWGAVSNAIANAVGVYFDTMPITPEKILKALGKV